MGRWPRHCLLLSLTTLLLPAKPALSETIVLPITLEYPLIRSLFVSQAYPGPGEVAVVLDDPESCARIELSNPEVGPEGSFLRLGSKIKTQAAIPISGRCLNPVEWEGYVELVEQVSVDKQKWQLAFETVDSRLSNQDRQPVQVASMVWDLIKTYVHPYFNRVHLDLGPPIQEIKDALPQFFEPEFHDRLIQWLASIRPGTVSLTPDALRANILMDVETVPPAQGKEAPIALSEEELKTFISAWETWDSFLVYQVLVLGAQPLTDDERQVVLETLLDVRYQFIREMRAPKAGHDLVREQFVQAWLMLSPILRKHLMEDTVRSPLSYLGFFTASDALAALDKLGPTLQIEISRDGLLRLAKLLVAEGGPPPVLEYSFAVDPNLRKTLGMGPPLAESGPAFEKEELDLPEAEPSPEKPAAARGISFWGSLAGTAWAATEPLEPDAGELKAWIPPAENPGPYLDRVKSVLREMAESSFKKGKLDPHEYRDLYGLVVSATAWQESCWCQFVQKGTKLTYLRSYNNTSVGLMQINERVWRGVYNTPRLRWNVPYNVQAGCEILELYLERCAVQRMKSEKKLAPDLLARAVYAMYNGGPGQLEGFLKRHDTKSYNLTDRLFEEKYSWVKSGQWDRMSGCLPTH